MTSIKERFDNINNAVSDNKSDLGCISWVNENMMFQDFLSEKLRGTGKYCFTVENAGGAYATFVMDCHIKHGVNTIPSDRSRDKMTVLLHWGLDSAYLDDLDTWGHEKCSYKIEEVPYSALAEYRGTCNSNYWGLFDSFVSYKETGAWENKNN